MVIYVVLAQTDKVVVLERAFVHPIVSVDNVVMMVVEETHVVLVHLAKLVRMEFVLEQLHRIVLENNVVIIKQVEVVVVAL